MFEFARFERIHQSFDRGKSVGFILWWHCRLCSLTSVVTSATSQHPDHEIGEVWASVIAFDAYLGHCGASFCWGKSLFLLFWYNRNNSELYSRHPVARITLLPIAPYPVFTMSLLPLLAVISIWRIFTSMKRYCKRTVQFCVWTFPATRRRTRSWEPSLNWFPCTKMKFISDGKPFSPPWGQFGILPAQVWISFLGVF